MASQPRPPRPPRCSRSRPWGAVLTVGLNRPAKRNALNDGIILAIQDCFSHLPDGIGAVVIHGIGDHFSSGLDLVGTDRARCHRRLDGHSQMWHRVFDRIQYSRVPVIAALQGCGDRRRAGACLRGAYPRRRAFGLFRAARGTTRHFRRRRRIGAAAAADRGGADDRHDADGKGLFRDRRRVLRLCAISHRRRPMRFAKANGTGERWRTMRR